MSEQDSEFLVREVTHERNGHAAVAEPIPPPVVLFRIPARWERIELGEPYTGAWAEMHTNPSERIANGLNGPTVYQTVAALTRSWNLAGEDGAVLPITEDGVQELPLDVLMALIKAWQAARALPLVKIASTSTSS
jgi:hypothetical protein